MVNMIEIKVNLLKEFQDFLSGNFSINSSSYRTLNVGGDGK